MKKSVSLPNKDFDENIFSFPKSEQIIIDKSNLHIQLDKFKQAIKKSVSIFDALSIIALWAPVFTADFKSIKGINADFIQGGYMMMSIIITVTILYIRIAFLFKKQDVDVDPEKMAEKILMQCQQKNNK